jgi:hypothetical protein
MYKNRFFELSVLAPLMYPQGSSEKYMYAMHMSNIKGLLLEWGVESRTHLPKLKAKEIEQNFLI